MINAFTPRTSTHVHARPRTSTNQPHRFKPLSPLRDQLIRDGTIDFKFDWSTISSKAAAQIVNEVKGFESFNVKLVERCGVLHNNGRQTVEEQLEAGTSVRVLQRMSDGSGFEVQALGNMRLPKCVLPPRSFSMIGRLSAPAPNEGSRLGHMLNPYIA